MTRGESVTFLKRYNDNVVEPAIASSNAVAFASEGRTLDLSLEATTVLQLDITAPTDGFIIVNGNASIGANGGIEVDCWINIDDLEKTTAHGVSHAATGGPDDVYLDEWADNIGFDVTAGDHTLYLVCQQMNGSDDESSVRPRRMTVVFSANSL